MKKRRIAFFYFLAFTIAGGTIALSNVTSETLETAPQVPVESPVAEQAATAEDDGYMRVPLGSIELEPLEGVAAKESSVDFPHSLHFDFRCQRCHHKWEYDEQLQSCTASGCHDQPETPGKGQGKKIRPEVRVKYFKIAYHQMCITCHKSLEAENLESGMPLEPLKERVATNLPTGCIECHPKD